MDYEIGQAVAIAQTPARTEVRVIDNFIGTASIGQTQPVKMRAWLLESRELIIATATPDFQIARSVFKVDTAKVGKTEATILLEDGQTVSMKLKSCSCGMGILGSARPMEGRISITRVATPEWVSTL